MQVPSMTQGGTMGLQIQKGLPSQPPPLRYIRSAELVVTGHGPYALPLKTTMGKAQATTGPLAPPSPTPPPDKATEAQAVFVRCALLLNRSQVSVQASPGCLNTSTHSQGDQSLHTSSWGDKKKEGHDG